MTGCRRLGLSVLLISCLALSGQAAEPSWVRDALGRPFRVGFDPGDRVLLGGGWRGRLGPALATGSAEIGSLEAGVLIRGEDRDDDSAWKLDHAVLLGRVDFASSGAPTVDAQLYGGRFLRWTRAGYLTWPGSPPKRIPFPLDIGAEVHVARFSTTVDAPDRAAELRVLDAALLFDVVRSPLPGRWVTFGVGPAYGLTFDALSSTATVGHVVAPFSRLVVAGRYEWNAGRQLVDADADVAYAWGSLPDAFELRASASASYELVLFAINDAPVSARVDVSWRYDDTGHALNAGAGLRLGWPLASGEPAP